MKHARKSALEGKTRFQARRRPGRAVKASWTDEAVTVEISDTGPGMAPSKRQGKRRRSLLWGLRSRLESFGGELTIESQAGLERGYSQLPHLRSLRSMMGERRVDQGSLF
jgi:signal transduction histidine kinase